VLLRLVMGLVKGLVLGALVGYGLAAAGMGTPGALIVYPVAVVVGVLVALVAGKPIWAKDARIEVGTKAVAAAILAPGLMWLVRSFVTMGIPFDVGALPGLESLAGQSLTLGSFAVTSVAMVAAVLAGFFDADNSPEESTDEKGSSAGSKKRIAVDADSDVDAAELLAELEAEEAEAPKRKKKV
jgi:hypothetical protein